MRLAFPITKIEKQEDGSLKVSGLATDETLDSQGDILDYAGSKAAFANWRGNVREAHDPKKPVGKALNVNFDDAAKAIEVEAFISSGAPETQQKILDGVLRSFSVGGGNPTKVRMEKVGDKTVRRVLEWPMTELSVVDVGANPNANISLVKSDGIATAELATDQAVEEAVNRFSKALLAELNKGKGKKKAEEVEGEKAAPGTGDGQSNAKIDPAAADVEHEGAAPGTAQQSQEVEGTVSIPPSVPISIPPAESVEALGSGTPAAPQSAAPKPAAEAVAAAQTGTPAAPQSAAPKASAEDAEGVKAGDEPSPSDDAIEDSAEAGGSDTEKDMMDGKKKKTTVKATDAPTTKFVGADGLDHVPDGAVPQAMPVGNQGAPAATKEEEPDGDEPLSPPADPPDRFVQNCKGHGIANCDKCSKDDGGMALDDGGMALAAEAKLTKSLEPLLRKLIAEEIAKLTADAPGVFKVNHGDQMAEGIGKGLSVVTTGIAELGSEVAVVKTAQTEMAKAVAEFKGELLAELKGICKSIDVMGKTAAVPTPLRTVPGASLEKSSPSLADTLDAMANGETDPELKAKLAQRAAIARVIR